MKIKSSNFSPLRDSFFQKNYFYQNEHTNFAYNTHNKGFEIE
jgi:hypothetical protein